MQCLFLLLVDTDLPYKCSYCYIWKGVKNFYIQLYILVSLNPGWVGVCLEQSPKSHCLPSETHVTKSNHPGCFMHISVAPGPILKGLEVFKRERTTHKLIALGGQQLILFFVCIVTQSITDYMVSKGLCTTSLSYFNCIVTSTFFFLQTE